MLDEAEEFHSSAYMDMYMYVGKVLQIYVAKKIKIFR